MLIAVKKLNSKHSQTSTSLINFQGKTPIFMEFQVSLKRHSIPALFKKFKDLHQPCSNQKLSCVTVFDYTETLIMKKSKNGK